MAGENVREFTYESPVPEINGMLLQLRQTYPTNFYTAEATLDVLHGFCREFGMGPAGGLFYQAAENEEHAIIVGVDEPTSTWTHEIVHAYRSLILRQPFIHHPHNILVKGINNDIEHFFVIAKEQEHHGKSEFFLTVYGNLTQYADSKLDTLIRWALLKSLFPDDAYATPLAALLRTLNRLEQWDDYADKIISKLDNPEALLHFIISLTLEHSAHICEVYVAHPRSDGSGGYDSKLFDPNNPTTWPSYQ